MMNNVRMMRQKFVAENDQCKLYELKDNSAIDEILQEFIWREKEN